MYKKTASAEQFGSRSASHSLRPFANGRTEPLGDRPLEIRPSYREQYDARKRELALIKQRCAYLDNVVRGRCQPEEGSTVGEAREQLKQAIGRREDLIRQVGSARKILEDGLRLEFEKLFVHVAESRLPKDIFLLIVQEARDLWRHEGWAEQMPRATRNQQNRAQKMAARSSYFRARGAA